MNKIKGDLITLAKEGKFDVIVHGANCFNTMGGGIARQIKDHFPDAWLADQHSVWGDTDKLGCYTIGNWHDLVIVNAYTQYGMNKGKDMKDLFEYDSFKTILNKLAVRYPNKSFGFPMIGMGLAGGDSEKIMALLKSFSEKIENDIFGSVTIVEFA
jgi:O-acetyl-ADP-ribose deacetylase (regulator of RNase III)